MTASLAVLRNNCDAKPLTESVPTVCGGGTQLGLITASLDDNEDAPQHDIAALATPGRAWPTRCGPW